VLRAHDKEYRATDLVRTAMALAGRPTLARVGIRGELKWLTPETFVDGASWRTIDELNYAIRAGGPYTFAEVLEIPSPATFRRELVERPREAMEILTRLARLPAGSAELRALRTTLGKDPRPRKKGARAARSRRA
jgi:hypothetical protein